MTPHALADIVLSTSERAHPNYSKEQHLAWTIGILATTVVNKNTMDNVIWARLEAQLAAVTDASDDIDLDQLARSTKPKQVR